MDTATARTRLEDMLCDLDRSISILTGQHPGFDMHPADAGASLTDADRAEAAVEAMERQRSAVLAALRRLENGVYGRCVDCGQPVSEGRLDARPDAARCVICQGKYDKTQH